MLTVSSDAGIAEGKIAPEGKTVEEIKKNLFDNQE